MTAEAPTIVFSCVSLWFEPLAVGAGSVALLHGPPHLDAITRFWVIFVSKIFFTSDALLRYSARRHVILQIDSVVDLQVIIRGIEIG